MSEFLGGSIKVHSVKSVDIVTKFLSPCNRCQPGRFRAIDSGSP